MYVSFTPGNIAVINSAFAWASFNSANLAITGVSESGFTAVRDAVAQNKLFTPAKAARTFPIVFFAEANRSVEDTKDDAKNKPPKFPYDRDEIDGVLIKLLHASSPRAIYDRAQKLDSFRHEFMKRVVKICRLAFGASIIVYAQPAMERVEEAKVPVDVTRPHKPTRAEKGPSRRAIPYRDAAAKRMARSLSLTGEQGKRYILYKEQIDLLLAGKIDERAFAESVILIWQTYSDDLSRGGFLHPLTMKRAIERSFKDETSIWDLTVERI